MQRFLFIFGLPFMVALSLTIPDCSRPKYEKYYILTFVMSISWISIISSYMVRHCFRDTRAAGDNGGAAYRITGTIYRVHRHTKNTKKRNDK